MADKDELIAQLANPNTAEASGRELARMGAAVIPSIAEALRRLAGPQRLLADVLLQIRGHDAVELFKELIFDDDTMVQLASIEALGFSGSARAVGPLEKLLDDDDQLPIPKGMAAVALGNLGNAGTIEALTSLMARADKEKEPILAISCAVGLAKLGDHRGFPIIARTVKGRSQPTVRTAAAEAMCHVTGSGMLSVLQSASKDKYWEVRRAAVEALYYLGTRDAMDILVQTADDRDETTANNALVYLRRTTGEELDQAPAAIKAWWASNRDRFPTEVCFRLGAPIQLTALGTMLQDPLAQFDIAREFSIYTGRQFGPDVYVRANLGEVCRELTELAQELSPQYATGGCYKSGRRVDLPALSQDAKRDP